MGKRIPVEPAYWSGVVAARDLDFDLDAARLGAMKRKETRQNVSRAQPGDNVPAPIMRRCPRPTSPAIGRRWCSGSRTRFRKSKRALRLHRVSSIRMSGSTSFPPPLLKGPAADYPEVEFKSRGRQNKRHALEKGEAISAANWGAGISLVTLLTCINSKE